MRDISAGTSFETTETIPRPPTDITGSVSASSPDSTRKSSGTARQISHICVTLPDASFTPTMFGDRAQADDGGDVHVDAGAAGDVVDDDRQRHRVGDRLVMLEQPFRRGLVVVRRDRQDAVGAGARHLLRRLDDLVRVVAARPREHRHPALRFRDDDLDDAAPLVGA